MFSHTKRFQYAAKPDAPDPIFAKQMQELIGGQWGEMSVMMGYLFQGWNCRGPAKYRDMLMDTATEEIGHVEMLATMWAQGHPWTARGSSSTCPSPRRWVPRWTSWIPRASRACTRPPSSRCNPPLPDSGRRVVPTEQSEVSLSVVVPALNEEGHVGLLLSDIGRQTRRPQEVIVVDAGSHDGTVGVAEGFAGVRVLHGDRPVARGRNLGGRSATGDVVVFLDADARLPEVFLERFLEEFLRRGLDVACPLYAPHDSTPAVERFHGIFNVLTRTFQGILPSGAGICVAVRGDLFRRSRGFDPGLKFDDIELIRRLSRGRRFGIVEEKVFVSDRRYRERGVTRAILEYSLMALIFALGKFGWANRMDYEFGDHAH